MAVRRPRRSYRDTLRANDAAQNAWAAASGKPPNPAWMNDLPAKRAYKKSGKPTEAPILKAILQALKLDRRVALVWRQNAGTMGDSYIRLGPTGMPDIVGVLKGGMFFAIEVKAPGRYPDERQAAMIDLLRSHGAVSGWATSVESALALLPL